MDVIYIHCGYIRNRNIFSRIPASHLDIQAVPQTLYPELAAAPGIFPCAAARAGFA
jgi:hypothetical protein